jgi:hypothetical protein
VSPERRAGLHHLGWLLPLAVAGALYASGSVAEGWILDDNVNLARHAAHGDLLGEWLEPTYAHAGGARGHIWRPVPASLQHLAAILFGRHPPVFRLLNVALHLLNVALVHRLARLMGASGLAAGLAALLFTLHPALPETVCWSSDVYDLALATALLGAAVSASLRPPRASGLVGAVALLLVACLCKETALAFTPVLVLLVGWRNGWRPALLVGLGAGLCAGLYLLAHGWVTGEGYGAAGAQSALSEQLAAWLTTAGWLLWVPHRAPLSHLFDPAATLGPALGALTLALGLLLVGLAWRRRPEAAGGLVVAGAAWVCLLAPVGLAIPLIGLHSFRYVYAPLALVVALAAPAAAGLLARLPRGLVVALLLLWCLPAAWRSSDRVGDWRDPERLWLAELEREPDNPYAMAQLGRLRSVRRVDVERSLALWAAALARAPEGTRLFDPLEERWDLAQAAFLAGQPAVALEQAAQVIERSSALGRSPPRDAFCLVADAWDALGRPDEAAAVEDRCPLTPPPTEPVP